MFALIGIINMIVSAIIILVIGQFIISLLFSFNVVGRSEFLEQVYRSINMLLDPLLSPIRKIMPETGAIDFSPIVLILILRAITFILADIAV